MRVGRPTGCAQQLQRFKQRQADDATGAAAEVLDEGRAAPLQGIGAGLAKRLAADDVVGDVLLAQGGEAHLRGLQCRMPRRAALHADRGEHLVRFAGEGAKNARRVVSAFRLAVNHAVQRHGGVGAQQHGGLGRDLGAATGQTLARRLQLETGDALHIVGRGLAGQRGFQRFAVFVGQRRQQREGHADLPQQLLSPRAGGGQIDGDGRRAVRVGLHAGSGKRRSAYCPCKRL